MANSILNQMSQSNNPAQVMQRYRQFRNSFSGNPQQMVQQMLQSGRINEAQLQQAIQMAKQFQNSVK